MPTTPHEWRRGQRVHVRGADWIIAERTPFADCESLRLDGATADNAVVRTLLTPFDRPRLIHPSSSIEMVRARGWLHALRRAWLHTTPAGGLDRAASSRIDLLPYQLEPALAMIRMGTPRVMIADAVGLGKTIQAGVVLSQLASASAGFRALVIGPAGLREQWVRELSAHFDLDATIAGASWLAAAARDLPPDVNPWDLPGIYVSSFDFVKRPEVLVPLEQVTWDLLVVDEAHGAALATARRAAVHAVGLRSRRVLLLTATPHSGDAEQFEALCRLGEAHAADPIVVFRRSRADAGSASRRRTSLLPIALSPPERRMHRLLNEYTALVCREAALRGDSRARLAAIVLKKRALSSAASLEVSARKRLALLAAPVSPLESQLLLPLDEDPLEDREPDAVLAAPGLADGTRERRWLNSLIEAAHDAACAESKPRVLRRLLARMREPAIVFTEYRDTLERLHTALAGAGHDLAVLHGGMPPAERASVQDAFNHRAMVLLATDAASEGLNLHGRCRTVIHYELPWSPARLEQRAGRVDRIGQARRVHEILFVAGDTAERLVLAPLARRAARARAAMPGSPPLAERLGESRVAGAIMDGERLTDPEGDTPAGLPSAYAIAPSDVLHHDATAEASWLRLRRAWLQASNRTGVADGTVAAIHHSRRPGFPRGLICVYTLTLETARGDVVHGELLVAHDPSGLPQVKTSAEARSAIRDFLATREPAVRAAALAARRPSLQAVEQTWVGALNALERRERAMAGTMPSAARQLVQAGLFDQRALRAQAVRNRAAGALLEAAGQRLDALTVARRLSIHAALSCLLISTGPGR